ncbi:PAS domain-containing sensor histidine kinase [Maridesulfovibrio sp. FT414]|uniref:sensor histidine kinase n=1 Tax=Maridesulfovibrio sp. FT414 TaxID=2979469 RepID=UPI003D804177
MSLTFLFSFVVFIVVENYRFNQLSKYQHSIQNQQARASLGKAVLNRLLMIELDLRKIVDSEDVRSVDLLQGMIKNDVSSISDILSILHHGGVFTNTLPANFYEFDQIEEHISFSRGKDDGYVVEVIDLTPKIIELEEAVDEIAGRKKMLLETGGSNEDGQPSDHLHVRYMKVEALILRARESASKVFYETQREILRLSSLQDKTVRQIYIVSLALVGSTLVICLLLFLRIFTSLKNILNDREQKASNLEEAKLAIEIILDSIPVGIIIVNDRKDIVRANTEALRLFEASGPDEILNRKCSNLFCLSSEEACPFENELSPTHVAEIRIKTCKGRELTVLKNATNISLAGERLVLEAFMDISHRLEMEDRLHEEQMYANAVLQGVQAGVVVIHAESHTIVDMNEAAAAVIGVDREEAIGAVCHKYICPAEVGRCPVTDLEQKVDHAVRLLANGKSVLKSVVPLYRGGELYLLENFVDITDRVKIEDQLKKALKDADRASRAKTKFLTRMGHELRAPLNAVIGFSDLLLDGAEQSLGTRQIEQVEHIKVAGMHLMQMITKVLDFSRIESGNLRINIESVSVDRVVEACRELLEQQATLSSVTVKIEPSIKNLPPVRADLTYLKQVLLSIMSNAVKYNRIGGTVSVRGEVTDNGMLALMVEDTGIGIPEKNHDEIFNPFTRFAGKESSIEGIGVGLAVSRQLIESMDGNIHIESSEGVGALFTVEIPVANYLPAAG